MVGGQFFVPAFGFLLKAELLLAQVSLNPYYRNLPPVIVLRWWVVTLPLMGQLNADTDRWRLTGNHWPLATASMEDQ